MRISDWSSDVCSSDLAFGGKLERVVVDREIHLNLAPVGQLVDLVLAPWTDPARDQRIIAGPQKIGRVGGDAAVAGAEAHVDADLARFDLVVRNKRGHAVGEFAPLRPQAEDGAGRGARPRRADGVSDGGREGKACGRP